jgi:hypothetical protein
MRVGRRWTARLALGAAFNIGLLLCATAPVAAAMWVRTSLDPPIPLVGQNVRVSVLTFYLTHNLCWDAPAASPIPHAQWHSGGSAPEELRLQLQALGPESAQVLVPLTKRASDAAYWDGVITFPSAGEWKLFVSFADQPSPNPRYKAISDAINNAGRRCGGFERDVTVRSTQSLAGSASVLTEALPGPGAPPTKTEGSTRPGSDMVQVLPAAVLLLTLSWLVVRRLSRLLRRHHV